MNTKDGIFLSTLLMLSACGGAPAGHASAKPDLADTASPLAPAIVSPAESEGSAQPASYEVAIATAAADHNKALDRCKSQPESVRTQCEQEANAAFSESREQLQDLRGNQN